MIMHRTWVFAAVAAITMTAGANEPSPAQTGPGVQYTGSMKIDEQGVPRALFNLRIPSTQHSPELAARSFLASYNQALRLGSAHTDLVTAAVVDAPGGTHVRFQQRYNGLPVHEADVVVSVNSLNEITMVINNGRTGIETPVSPSFGATEAINIVRDILKTSDRATGQDDSATLVVFADQKGVYYLAYRVTMTREEPAGDWEVIIDATTGDLLQSRDLFVEYEENHQTRGSGFVYLTDPLSAARQKYGTVGFSDNDDQDSDSLSAYRSLVVLDSVTFTGGNFVLRGPYCTIMDIESPLDTAITSPTPDGFQFDRSQMGFEAVNTYYHASEAYKRVRDLGFSSSRLRKIRIDPHGFQGLDNSHYSPSGNWIAFGTGGVDDAEDADVIWHEYGHAIQYAFSPTWGGGESAALGEGYSDYWAASYARSLNQWTREDDQFAWVYKWDGHNVYWSGRRLDDANTYPFENPSPHVAGQVWSSTLMGIWSELGRDVTDRIVLKSLHYLGYGATASDAANAILQADRDLYNGSHAATLGYWLGTVKHFIDPATVENPSTGIEDLQQGVPASFTLAQNFPNPFNPSTTIGFDVPSGKEGSGGASSRVRLAVYDLLGREVAVLEDGQKSPGHYEVRFDASGLASGVYLCRMDVRPGDGSSPLSFTRKMAFVR